MKHILTVFLMFLSLSGLFSGCKKSASPIPTHEYMPSSAESTMGETTAPETTVPLPELPYLEKIPYPDQSVYAGPSYDFGFVGTVQVAGTYTIMEEAWDNEGNLWGRLKSGMGWVDLSDIRDPQRTRDPISANYADQTLLNSGNYHHCIADTSEYTVQIAFRAAETLTNVSFYTMDYMEGYQKVDELYFLTELIPSSAFVADVSFPGDMSMFGISFTDSEGILHHYFVYISGRNGSLILTAYTP